MWILSQKVDSAGWMVAMTLATLSNSVLVAKGGDMSWRIQEQKIVSGH